MNGITAENAPLKPKPSKAEITDNVARAIIGAEIERRDAKTARLRLTRLEAEARLSVIPDPTKKPRRVKPAAPRSRASK